MQAAANKEVRNLKVKICGLFRNEDIDYVNEARPDYVGFVFYEKSHRNISLEKAYSLKEKLVDGIKTVGVFVDETADSLLEYAKSGVFDVLQLHGGEDNAFIYGLKEKTDIEIWQAFKLRTAEDVKKANDSAADMLVLDNGKGTGMTFDWTLLGEIKRDFFLAGGINTKNIDEAIKLAPYGIDCSSGAETDRIKDKEKIKYIVAKCHGQQKIL